MSQSSEQIEAKLCAYLEGELDEQGRAEIEKHLAGNPAHRRLLAEVARTRDLVRALPRESAPADLCEQFQGHLERAVLLANEAEASALRIGRWRPVLAMAALVVLAVGVGLVIYFGLPSAVPQRTVVSNTPASSGANEAAEAKVLSESATAPAEAPLAVAQAETDAVLRDRFSADGAGEGKAPNGGSPASVALMSGQAATSPVATSQPLAPSLPALAQQVPKLWSTEQQRALFFARTGAKDASGTAPANAPG